MTVNGREAISAAQVSNGAVGSRGTAEIHGRCGPDDKKCIVSSIFFSIFLSFFLSTFLSFFLSFVHSVPPLPPPLQPSCITSSVSLRPCRPAASTPPPPPPLQPRSLFLANLKFVRRLRLLDGWPLIFCELHLAQTSRRPPCILLTAALVAGPRHLSQPRPPNASSLQEPRHQLNPPPPRRLRACKHT